MRKIMDLKTFEKAFKILKKESKNWNAPVVHLWVEMEMTHLKY